MMPEFLNIHGEVTPEFKEYQEDYRKYFLEDIGEVVIPPEQVDPRLLEFEQWCNQLNYDRAKFYGRSYTEPQVIYFDGLNALENKQYFHFVRNIEPNRRGQIILQPYYDTFSNQILVGVNRFDDSQIDLFNSLISLFHEMNHAGSVVKLRMYPRRDIFPTATDWCGAKVYTDKWGYVGRVLDEEYVHFNERIFLGYHQSLRKKDHFLKDLPLIEELVPGGYHAYFLLRQMLMYAKIIPQTGHLTLLRMVEPSGWRRLVSEDRRVRVGYAYKHFEVKLVDKIIKKDPSLYESLRAFIYGGRMGQCARAFDERFSEGFFRELMTLEWKNVEEFCERI